MTSKGANGKNKGTHDPIRRKPKRNMTPIRGNTTSDSVSNGWSFVIFQVIHIFFLLWNTFIILKVSREEIGGQLVSLKVSIPINWLINPRTFM